MGGCPGFLLSRGFIQALLEFINPTSGINEFALTGVKRVTIRTDFHGNSLGCRTCLPRMTARARDGYGFMIRGVNIGFHMRF